MLQLQAMIARAKQDKTFEMEKTFRATGFSGLPPGSRGSSRSAGSSRSNRSESRDVNRLIDRYRSNKHAGEKNWLTTSPMGKVRRHLPLLAALLLLLWFWLLDLPVLLLLRPLFQLHLLRSLPLPLTVPALYVQYTAYPKDLPPTPGGNNRVPYVLCGATVSKLFA